jgi:hypothetical protein
MQHMRGRLEGLSTRFRSAVAARTGRGAGLGAPAAKGRKAAETRASALGMQAGMKLAWVISVTALAGRRRSA